MANTILTLLSRPKLEEYYAAGFWRTDTIYSLVEQFAASSPNRVAVRDRFGTLTYSELANHAIALSEQLLSSGLRAGDRVAVWLSSRVETAIILVACSRAGFVCCPSLHRDHTVADVLELLNRMRAKAFFGEDRYGADAERSDIFAQLNQVASLQASYRLAKPGQEGGDKLPKSANNEPSAVKPDPDSVVYLAFTSGTTGRPKGVMHSDNTLLANARAMIKDWHFDAESVVYTMSPLSHNLGLGSLVMSLAAGAELVIHDLPRGQSTLDRIVEVGATFVVGVPTHAIDLLDEMGKRKMSKLGAVKGFRVSGASAPTEVIRGLLNCGIYPQSGYGMTEAGSHHYTHIGDAAERIVNTSGRSCDGYEVRIFSRDDPEKQVPVGEIGQIGGRGASLMLGYYNDQDANDNAFNTSGWFLTGDLGRLDEDGYLTITGRKKDLIIRGGHNIYPTRIENLTMQHPDILRAAALPVPDQRLGEKVCLAMMPRPGASVSAEEVLAHLDDSGLSRYDMPEYYLFLDEIPLTASGKILKREIASRIDDGSLSPQPIRFVPREALPQ